MADYFQEMGWDPQSRPSVQEHLNVLLRAFYFFRPELENIQSLPPPASKSVTENLPKIPTDKSGSKCPICLKEHEKGELVTKLPCNHTFHDSCILAWFSKTNSCPLCRFELPTDDEHYEAIKKEKFRAKQREADIEILHNSMYS